MINLLKKHRKEECDMTKKLVSIIAAGMLAVQALAIPMVSAEDTAKYIENSDFTDCSIGGNSGQGYYGLGIILDGSPWLSKGSASVHYQTYSHDDVRNVNYCHMYSNSDKTGSGDGAGSFYMYQRNLTAVNQIDPYGLVEFDVRVHEDSQNFNFMMGWFEDPTSGGFNGDTDVCVNLVFGPNGIQGNDGKRMVTLAAIVPEKWYKVRVTTNNKFEEYSATITDIDSGKTIGALEDVAYKSAKPEGLKGIKTTCWGYIRGNTYNYDLTNVTIARSNDKYSAK